MLNRIKIYLKRIIFLSLEAKSHTEKECIIKKYQRIHRPRIFIETGTYLGEMVEAMQDFFDKIYSIELNRKLYQETKSRFTQYKKITILQGDSSVILPRLLKTISEPALFWLDGHYSGGITSKGNINTPIRNELFTIFEHPVKHHIILIDDARLFNGTEDYPSYKEIMQMAKKFGYTLKKEQDIFIISHV